MALKRLCSLAHLVCGCLLKEDNWPNTMSAMLVNECSIPKTTKLAKMCSVSAFGLNETEPNVS